MAHDPGSLLDRLPNELLLNIIDSESAACGKRQRKVLSPRDLISLARTSRRYYTICVSTAYERHVEEEEGLAIYWAIKNDQFGTLQRLVEHGVDVNMRDSDESFHGAPIDLVERFTVHNLQRTKAFVGPGGEARFSPLAWAADNGQDSMVEYLLDHGADIEQKSRRLCPCRYGKMIRCPDRLQDPLEFYSADPSDDGESTVGIDFEDDQWTPLHNALCNGMESTARLLIERGANANELGELGATALHFATRWELNDTIQYLLDNKCVNINSQGICGVTALLMAQVAGREDLVDKYLDEGADIKLAFEQRSGPWTIFIMACADGYYERALEYLRRGADPQFILKHVGEKLPWTVMRLIYEPSGSAALYSRGYFYERMKLEQEIIARGNGKPAAT